MVRIALIAVMLMVTPSWAGDLKKPTSALDGKDITYSYTTGREYNLRFKDGAVSYRYLSGSKPDKWWGPFPYKAFEVDENTFMLAWFERDYGDYVTLLVNFDNRLIYGSALLGGEKVHFHGATLSDSTAVE